MSTQFVIHVKTNAGGFQISKPCIVCTYISEGEGGLMARCLQSRKVQHEYMAKRNASPEEVETEKNSYRVQFILYEKWEALINDEKKFTTDEEWFKQLAILQKKFPQF